MNDDEFIADMMAEMTKHKEAMDGGTDNEKIAAGKYFSNIQDTLGNKIEKHVLDSLPEKYKNNESDEALNYMVMRGSQLADKLNKI